MKILVTGARGFTGIHFIETARAMGHETISLAANLNDARALEKEVLAAAPEMVAHLAGISFVASKDEEAFYRVHALGTSSLLNALLKLPIKPQKVLLASSATVYGNSPNPFSVEDQELKPIDHYAISKVAMEEMAKTFMDRLPIIIARPFNYTGHGQKGNFLIPKFVRHFAEQIPSIELGNLEVEREFNDVEMICSAYLALLQFGVASQTYNVSTGNARSLKQVMRTLIELTGHPIDIKINPDFVRASEVHRMCGNPSKLMALMQEHGLTLPIPTLEETLTRMLIRAKSNIIQP